MDLTIQSAPENINGRYIIQNEIGAGGMGVVFEAYDRLTSQTIALKRVRLNQEWALADSYSLHDSLAQLRFVLAKEFQTLAGLRHPNIISVIDYGFDAEQQPFYTMPLLTKNQTILDYGRTLDFEGKINLIEQLLLGLVYLHRRGILHRDIKPENVLVTNGTVRLLDFGLSQKVEEEGVMGGSPLYMAPELLDGDEATQATDLYAVGVLLFQLLTDQHPFGDYDEGFYDRASNLDLNLDLIDVRLHGILSTLLASSPADRADSATAVIHEIAKALGHQPSAETDAIRESYLQAASFVGRHAEINRLAAALKAANEGDSSAWLIGGESGVGKSRLLDELQTMALVNGWQIWRGQAAEVGGLSYQMWRDIVPKLVLSTDLSPIELSVLKEIAPHLDRLLDKHIPAAVSSNGADDQDRLVLTLIGALKRQTRPTLILLEDAHWARESLVPITQIISLINDLSHVMVVATYRSDERPDLPEQLPEAQNIELNRLSDSEIQQLSHAMLGDRATAPGIVSLLTQETEGNTFFIIEVMRALAEEAGQLDEITQMNLPTGVLTSGMETLLKRRIEKIPTGDQQLLQIAAVAGRQIDLSLLEQFVSKEKRDGWLQRGLDAAVLFIRDEQWFFSHDKLRETIINGLEPETLKVLHRHVAEAIEQLYQGDPSYDQSLLEHWHAAGDLDKEIFYLEPVVQYLIQAISELTKAEALIKRGLGMLSHSDPRRVSLLNWLTYVYMELRRAEKFREAFIIGNETKALAEGVNDISGLATSLYYLGYITFEIDGTDERANEYIQQSLTMFRELGNQKRISDNLILLGEISHNLGNFEESIAYHQEALSIVEAIGSDYGLGYTLDQLGQVYIIQGEYEKAMPVLLKSKETFEASGFQQRVGWTLPTLANIPMLLGRFDEAANYLFEALSVFEKYSIQSGMGYSLNNLGRVATLTEEYNKAFDYIFRSIEIFERNGIPRAVGYNLLQLGLLLNLLGEYENAEQHLQKGLTSFQELEDQRMVAYCCSRLGITFCKTKPEEAGIMLQKALLMAHDLDIEPLILEIALGYAYFYLHHNKGDKAAKLLSFVKHHHKTNHEIMLWGKMISPMLEESLSSKEFTKAYEEGKSFELKSIVQALLDEEKQLEA